ncbi:FMN reductase [Methylobacterium indicum]|uniref:FMN reductase n=1 Tax=Methylobacterium indicum TaxID=1775910 RepID=A0ABR5HEX7_9HYPH|nr:FMN reductase [Methylobacterium indicum]KMO12694.1 FMN reductase [Methylobacterium indicum]KMO25099.1 FMN reductase [Methylobacterium indicum]
MTRLRLVGFSANIQRPSKTRTLVEAIAAEAAVRLPVEVRIFDLVDAGPGLGGALSRDQLSLPARRIVEAVEEADALVVGTPVYKGAYTGLFKHLFDLVAPEALAGTPVALAATGGGPRHALVVEHSLRPLFGFFTALTVPTAVYASDPDFRDGGLDSPVIRQRVAEAGDQLATLAGARAPAAAAPLARVAGGAR